MSSCDADRILNEVCDPDTTDLVFAPEPGADSQAPEPDRVWKVLIVDDDPEVHAVTTLVLKSLVFEGRALSFLHAYSGDEGCRLAAAHPDIAVAFIDVVMESDDAGLKTIRHIRETLGNRHVRLVLRTGQPGQAPERDVVLGYDINDYRAKSELTAQKLFTTLIGALRSYRDLQVIEANRQGLRKIVASSSGLIQLDSLHLFVSGVLLQLTSLLGVERNGILVARHGEASADDAADIYLIAASGDYEGQTGGAAHQVLPPLVLDRIEAAFRARHSTFAADHCTLHIPVPNGRPVVGYVVLPPHSAEEIDTDLLEVFCLNVGVAFDNFRLFEQINQTHEASVLALGKLAEYHDKFTGDHLQRVEKLSREVATRLHRQGRFPDAIDNRFIDQFGLASALHDVGKVGIPRELLCKPGRLDAAEFEIMKQHTRIGHDILSKAAQKIRTATYLGLAAEIALTHHERYDGSGYPDGLAGDAIPLCGRIVAAVDVFDALSRARPYKHAWPRERVIEHLRAGAGTMFDPHVVEVLLEIVEDEQDGAGAPPAQSACGAGADSGAGGSAGAGTPSAPAAPTPPSP